MKQAQSTPRPTLNAILAILAAAAGLVVLALLVRRMPGLYHPTMLARAVSALVSIGLPREIPNSLLLVLFACFSLGGVTCLGMGIIDQVPRWRAALPTPADRLVLAPLVGGLPTALLILGTGLAGSLRYFVPNTPIILGLGLGIRPFCRDLLALFRNGRIVCCRSFSLPLVLLSSPIFILMVLYALAPPTESDELRYHLAAPAIWSSAGRIHYLPHQAFSNFPFLGEMLFMLQIPHGAGAVGAQGAKLVHVLHLFVCAGVIALWVTALIPIRRNAHGRRATAAAAALAFATIPTVLILSAWGFVDLIVTAYFLGFGYVAFLALRSPRRVSPSLLGWIGAGALGTKYTMAPLLLVAGAIWGFLYLRRTRSFGRTLRAGTICAAVSVLFASPWYLKNDAWTGNPVYPMAWSVFGGGDWSAENASFLAAKAAEKGMPNAAPPTLPARVGEFLATPYFTTFQPFWYEEHFIGPLPLLAVILLLCWLFYRAGSTRSIVSTALGKARVRRARLGAVWLAALIILTWAFWFVTYQSNRFLIPTLALWLIAAAAAAADLTRRAPAFARRLLVAAFACAFVANLGTDLILLAEPNKTVASRADAIAVAIGAKPADPYLAHRLNYYRAAQWLNNRSARHREFGSAIDGALLIGEHRTLYFEIPVIASDWFDTPQPLPLIRATPKNDILFDRLLTGRHSFVVLNANELGRWHDRYFRPRFTDEEYARFEALWTSPRLEPVRHFYLEGVEDVRIYRVHPRISPTNPSNP